MIFSNNSYYGIGSNIPAAEGYDCSYGTAQMMIESARNEYSMFEAMLNADYTEYSMRNSGYVDEGVGAAIKSAASNIWHKIHELLTKLVAKIKSIWNSFKAKMNTIFSNDATLIKKYKAQITKNATAIDSKVDISWCAVNNNGGEYIKHWPEANIDKPEEYWSENPDEIKDKIAATVVSGATYSNLKDQIDQDVFGAEHVCTIGEAGGIAAIMKFVENRKSAFDKLTAKVDATNKQIANAAKDAKRNAENAEKNVKEEDEASSKAAETAKHAYDVVSAYQQVMGTVLDCVISAARKDYKQNRAALAKAVTASASPKKLESTLLQAIGEAAEDEVDEVIDTSIDSCGGDEIADLTSASLNVLDPDAAPDPNALVYDKVDNYSDDAPMDDAEGEIDVDVNSREEAAYFSEMFY